MDIISRGRLSANGNNSGRQFDDNQNFSEQRTYPLAIYNPLPICCCCCCKNILAHIKCLSGRRWKFCYRWRHHPINSEKMYSHFLVDSRLPSIYHFISILLVRPFGMTWLAMLAVRVQSLGIALIKKKLKTHTRCTRHSNLSLQMNHFTSFLYDSETMLFVSFSIALRTLTIYTMCSFCSILYE